MISTSSSASAARLTGQLAINARLSGATLAPIDMPISRNDRSRNRFGMLTGIPAIAAAVTASAPPINHPAGRDSRVAIHPPRAETAKVRRVAMTTCRKLDGFDGIRVTSGCAENRGFEKRSVRQYVSAEIHYRQAATA